MEKKCLYKELKGSVNIDNLLKIGEIPVHVKVISAGNTREVTWIAGQVGTIRVLDGSNKICLAADSNYTNSITIAAGSQGRTFKLDTGEYDIAIGNYYNIKSLNLFSDSSMLFAIDINDTIGYITHARDFAFISSNVYGLDINNINPSADDFNSCLVSNTNMVGVYEDLIEKIIDGGRSSGKTNIEIGGTNITFKNISAKDWNRGSFIAYYSESGCTIRDSNNGPTSGSLLATYTKSTSTWTYEI